MSMPTQRQMRLQFLNLYHFIAADSVVYLLPASEEINTSKLALILEGKNEIVISDQNTTQAKKKSDFFELFGYKTMIAPYLFSGEADFKYLHDNIYLAAYESPRDLQALKLIAKNLEINIIKIKKSGLEFNTLDQIIFPLTHHEILVCTKLLRKSELKNIENVANIIDVDIQAAKNGICKSIRLHNMVLNASNIHELTPTSINYKNEIGKNRQLEDICAERGFEIVFFNLSEFTNKEVYLSSLLIHANHFSYLFETSRVVS